jgi:hypothetical protein
MSHRKMSTFSCLCQKSFKDFDLIPRADIDCLPKESGSCAPDGPSLSGGRRLDDLRDSLPAESSSAIPQESRAGERPVDFFSMTWGCRKLGSGVPFAASEQSRADIAWKREFGARSDSSRMEVASFEFLTRLDLRSRIACKAGHGWPLSGLPPHFLSP